VAKLNEEIPRVEKDLEKSQKDLANMISQENKVASEVTSTSDLCQN